MLLPDDESGRRWTATASDRITVNDERHQRWSLTLSSFCNSSDCAEIWAIKCVYIQQPRRLCFGYCMCEVCVCVWMHKITQKQPWLDFDEVFSVVITWDDNKSMKFWASVPTGETPGWLTFDHVALTTFNLGVIKFGTARQRRREDFQWSTAMPNGICPAAVAESPCWHCSALGFNKCSSSC